MKKLLTLSAVAGAVLLGSTAAALAAPGKFEGMSAYELAQGTVVHTDCSINGEFNGEMYCFFNEDSMAKFMAHPRRMARQAANTYAKMKTGRG